MSFTYLLNSRLGINGIFYVLGAVQIVAFIILSVFMKETKGLSAAEKKQLYSPISSKKSD
jgi:hypothetical protein